MATTDPAVALKQLAANQRRANGDNWRRNPLRGTTPVSSSTNLPAGNLSSFFSTSIAAAKAQVRGGDVVTQQAPPGTTVIEIPEGTWDVDQVRAMMGSEGMTGQGSGLVFRGQGMNVTTIRFTPTTAGDMLYNQFWQNVIFQDITFTAHTAGCTFLHINNAAESASQHFAFQRCEWLNFKYAFYLEGDNNGSEFSFHDCSAFQMKQAGGAFLRIPSTATDQFLNYYFSGIFRYWSNTVPIIDADKGGHFGFDHLDVSDWAGSMTGSQVYLFNLRGNSHNLGVCDFKAHHVRVEAKSAVAALLYSEWPMGNIEMSVDWGSQTFAYTYGNIITLNMGSHNGPQLYVHDSQMAGKIEVQYGANAYQTQPRIRFERCDWIAAARPSDVVTYTAQSGNDTIRPLVQFVACRAADDPYRSVYSSGGLSIWDATVGYLRQTGYLQQRQINITSAWGGLGTGDIPKVNLPLWATVTGLRVVYHDGQTAALNGTVSLKTAETTPATVATVTVNNGDWLGLNARSAQTPHLCSTAAKATLTVSTTVQLPTYASVIIEGYW